MRFEGFVGEEVELAVGPLGRVRFGVVDASAPGVSEAVSALLTASIRDARASAGGHLPDWLVCDVERNYVSAERVRTLWAATGYRFCAVLGGRVVGTVHVARSRDTILTVDRHTVNVSAREHPGFKPEGMHHVVNLSVKHELRRAHLGAALFDALCGPFRSLFDGDGLWLRADPPWHPSLLGLGFAHDPRRDLFLPEEAERTAGLPHAELNARFACACPPEGPWEPGAEALHREALQKKKLQYVSFTRRFEGSRARPAPRPSPSADDSLALRERHATDASGLERALPGAVALPEDAAGLCALLASLPRGSRAVLRGRGLSAAGQSLREGAVAVLTERLARVGAPREGALTVGCGASWEQVLRAALASGLTPTVLPAHLGASVGGTLSTGGFGKGSVRFGALPEQVLSLRVATGDGRLVECDRAQAGWLFRAALWGLGRFGALTEATLALRPAPRELYLREESLPDAAALTRALALATSEEHLFHLTSAAGPEGAWSLLRASEAPPGAPVPYARFVGLERPPPSSPRGRWLHAFVSLEALAPLLEAWAPQLRIGRGDSLAVAPVLEREPRVACLQPSVLAAGGAPAHAFAVLLTRAAEERSAEALDAELAELAEGALSLGARLALGGALPRTRAQWRARVGEGFEELARAKALADPRGVLEPL